MPPMNRSVLTPITVSDGHIRGLRPVKLPGPDRTSPSTPQGAGPALVLRPKRPGVTE